MATNKHASIRYRVLDECFRDTKKKYFFEDLKKACERALADYKEEVSERTIRNDIAFMKSDAGWNILFDLTCKDGKKQYYRYLNPEFSIGNQGLNKEETERIKDMILMLSRFKGLPAYGWVEELMATLEGRFNLEGNSADIIGFEQNKDLKGLCYLSNIIEATVNSQVLDIDYTSKGILLKWTIHPYYIKQYNNRWYLLGLNEDLDAITCVALDRILDLKENKDVVFRPNTKVDFDHYFDDVIGVTIPKHNQGKEIVILKFSEARFPMVLSKPLHHSQKRVHGEPNTIQLEVIPNKELEQQIFSFGNDVEVIAPQSLREDISRKIEEIYQKYFPLQYHCSERL